MAAKKKNINSIKPATKGDLEDLREDLQADMENMKESIISEVTYHFDATVENIRHDLVGANRDAVRPLLSQVPDEEIPAVLK